jgi:hypothetical protein
MSYYLLAMARQSLSVLVGRIPGFQRSTQMRKRGAVARMPVAGVFLLLELPLLLPVIAGAGLMTLVVGARALARRLSPVGG